MTQKIKKRAPLFIVFVVIYVAAFFLLNIYEKSRIHDMLNEQEKYLEMSYNQGLDRYESIAKNIYMSMQNDTKFINLLATTNKSNLEKKNREIYEHLKEEFEGFKLFGIMGILVTNPNNLAVVRMHTPEKYGDDITTKRPIVARVNEQKFHHHGLEEGKTSHAYRQVYPLYRDGVHIGALEVFFSSTNLQDYTMRASGIHTHFIVSKKVLDHIEWKSEIQEPYMQSIEHSDYLYSLNSHMHLETLKDSEKRYIEPLRKEIDKGISSQKSFALYKLCKESAKVISFHAIERFADEKTIAYMVSYTDVDKLYILVETINEIKLALFLFAFVLYFIITRLLMQKESVLNELRYDELTQVYTRKYFMRAAAKSSKRLKSKNDVFCVIMADIDYFKNVNDTYGHPYGDTVLKEFAALLKTSLRSVDMVARYGGEEFVILLHANSTNAYNIVETIRKKVQSHAFGEKSITVTASFGLTQASADSHMSVEELISKADEALYRAKANGRNQAQIV